MSALGHKRTCAMQKGMSALRPKADMCGATKGCPLSANSGHRRISVPLSINLSARVIRKKSECCSDRRATS